MEKIIRVTGEGLASVRPDTIEVGLSLSSVNKKYTKSISEVDEMVTAVKSELKKVGVEDVKTTNFSVRQHYSYDGRKNVPDGFETQHLLKISFDYDTNKLGDVIEKITASLAEPRLTLSFTSKNTDKAKEEALKDAVAHAKRDATALAKAAGVKLGDILLVNHSFGEVHVNYPARAEVLGEAAVSYESASVGSFRELDVNDIQIRANVTMEFAIG